MNERKAKPLRVELSTCIAVTVCGLNMHKSFLPDTLWARLFPVLTILGLVLCIVMLFLDMTKGTEQELAREAQDERNLMLQDWAAWFCRKIESVVWIATWIGVSLFTNLNTISYALYWIIILRYWLFFATRWWMNRKY